MQRARQVSAAVAETLEQRSLFSSVFELGGKLAFSPGGHGVSTDSGDIAAYFVKRGKIAQSVVADSTGGDPVLPAGITPYRDPNNPQVIGIDEDGLVVLQPSDDAPESEDPESTGIILHSVGSSTSGDAAVAGSAGVPSDSQKAAVDKEINDWQRLQPRPVKDSVGLVTALNLPDDLAAKQAQTLGEFKGADGVVVAKPVPKDGVLIEQRADGLRPSAVGSGVKMFGNEDTNWFDARDSTTVADGIIKGGDGFDYAYMDNIDDQPGVVTFSLTRVF